MTVLDVQESIATVWKALHAYRSTAIHEGEPQHDNDWSDICTAMAHIQELLNCEEEIDE